MGRDICCRYSTSGVDAVPEGIVVLMVQLGPAVDAVPAVFAAPVFQQVPGVGAVPTCDAVRSVHAVPAVQPVLDAGAVPVLMLYLRLMLYQLFNGT